MKSGAIEAQFSEFLPVGRGGLDVPSAILTNKELRSVVGIFDDNQFTNAEIDDLQVQGEDAIERYLGTPIKPRRIVERYVDLADALVLAPKRMHGRLGAFSDLTITVTTTAGETPLPDGWLLDSTGQRARITFTNPPAALPDSRLQAPVLVVYEFRPIVPAAVTAAVVHATRTLFVGRYVGHDPTLELRRWLSGVATQGVC